MTKKESKSPPSKQQIDLELEKAIASVTVVQTRTEQLHSQWRNQLVRLSCLVMLLSLHQCSQPALECVNDIKAQEMGSSQSLWATSQRVVGHSMMEVMGVLISFLLFRFTSMNDPPGDFSSQPYVAAASLIPFCAGIFINADFSLTCLGEARIMEEDVVKRQIPVSLVFHVIVSVCYWFMQLGKQQCENQVLAITQLKTQISRSRKNPEKKKMK